MNHSHNASPLVIRLRAIAERLRTMGNAGYAMPEDGDDTGPRAVLRSAADQLLDLTRGALPGTAAALTPVEWPNHCDTTVPAALRYLAENPRPAYGCASYNTEHLYQLADEIEALAQRRLFAAPHVIGESWTAMDSAPKDRTPVWLGHAPSKSMRVGLWMGERWTDLERNAPLMFTPTHWRHVPSTEGMDVDPAAAA